MTNFLQLSTKLQDLKQNCLSCKGAGAMHKSSSTIDSPIYYLVKECTKANAVIVFLYYT